MVDLELAEAPNEGVELAIGKLGGIELVIEPVVMSDERAQPVDLVGRRLV